MATPGEKLAEALQALKSLQDKQGLTAIKSSELSRNHRERLTKNGFIKEAAKGWYISTNPNEKKGESTSWYTLYWQFCSRFLKERYGEQYILSPDQSILMHSGNHSVPSQLLFRAPKAPNDTIELLYETSLFGTKIDEKKIGETIQILGMKCLSLPQALVNCTPLMYEKNTTEMMTALSLIKDSSDVLRILLDGSHSVRAGRLAGAFRNIGQGRIADDIIKGMKAADYDVREVNPFKESPKIKLSFRESSPYVNRIKLMWSNMRDIVIKHFPAVPGLPDDRKKYMQSIDNIYVTDAYHSLSIERYVVSAKLIEKIKTGDWDTNSEEDEDHKNAMAARGYYLATIAVKKSIEKILEGENSGKVIDYDHSDWYQALFRPSITAGICSAGDLAGYRNRPVHLTNSQHVPMNKDAVKDAMPTLMDLLQEEEHAGVRAILGHYIFVYIHPYIDGNGRMGRFLMNVMLASGGCPWTVIPVEQRDRYMDTLEEASARGNIEPFVKYLTYLIRENMKGTPVAKIKHYSL